MTWSAQLESCLAEGRLEQIAPLLDQAELESEDQHPFLNWPFALHLLGHVLNDDLVSARFLWKRFPQAAYDDREATAVWRLVKALWNHAFEDYGLCLNALNWSGATKPLIDAIAEKLQREMLDLISRVYTDIHITRMAELLSVSRAEACQCAERCGWKINGDFIEVVKSDREDEKEALQDRLQKLSKIITHLES